MAAILHQLEKVVSNKICNVTNSLSQQQQHIRTEQQRNTKKIVYTMSSDIVHYHTHRLP